MLVTNARIRELSFRAPDDAAVTISSSYSLYLICDSGGEGGNSKRCRVVVRNQCNVTLIDLLPRLVIAVTCNLP